RRTRAIADEPPTDAEQHRAEDERAIDRTAARRDPSRHLGATMPSDHAVEQRGDPHGARHDERKRRIPGAHVEERLHLGRAGHASDAEPHGEHEPGEQGIEAAEARHRPPSTTPNSATVSMPTATNTAVATSERGAPRATPHTPWPLVQPEPSCVP